MQFYLTSFALLTLLHFAFGLIPICQTWQQLTTTTMTTNCAPAKSCTLS